jgi:hypothetical protein
MLLVELSMYFLTSFCQHVEPGSHKNDMFEAGRIDDRLVNRERNLRHSNEISADTQHRDHELWVVRMPPLGNGILTVVQGNGPSGGGVGAVDTHSPKPINV